MAEEWWKRRVHMFSEDAQAIEFVQVVVNDLKGTRKEAGRTSFF